MVLGHSLGQCWASRGVPHSVWLLGRPLCAVVPLSPPWGPGLVLRHWAGIHVTWPVGLRLPLQSPHRRPGLLLNPLTTGQGTLVFTVGSAQAVGTRGIRLAHLPLCHLPSAVCMVKAILRGSKCKEGSGLAGLSVTSPLASMAPSCLSSCEGGILGPSAGIQATSQCQPLPPKAPRTRRDSPFSLGQGLPWGTFVLYP